MMKTSRERMFGLSAMAIFLTMQQASCNNYQRNGVCLKMRNVTFIMDTGERIFFASLYEPFFLKMLRNPCITVWMYSQVKRQLIRLEEQNLVRFLLSEEDVVPEHIETSKLLELTSRMPMSTQENEQHIIYIKPKIRIKQTAEGRLIIERPDAEEISERLKWLQNERLYNIILACEEHYSPPTNSFPLFCKPCKSWLPENKFFDVSFMEQGENYQVFKHLFKIWFDLVMNRNYDRFEHIEGLNATCLSNTSLDIYFEKAEDMYMDMEEEFLRNSIEQATKSTPGIKFLALRLCLEEEVVQALEESREPECASFLMSIYKEESPPPHKKSQKKMFIHVNDHMSERSPVLKTDNRIIVWAGDVHDPFFLRWLFKQMNMILC